MKKSMKYCVLTAAILAASSVSYADRDSDDRSIEDRLGDDIVELLNDYDDAALANIAINEADLDASVTIDADNLSSVLKVLVKLLLIVFQPTAWVLQTRVALPWQWSLTAK